MWACDLARGELEGARTLADRLLEIAEAQADLDMRVVAHRALASVAYFRGELAESCRQQELCLALYDPSKHGRLGFVFGQDPAVVSLTVAAQSLCLLGEFQRAVAVSTRAIQLGRDLRHAFSLAIALCFDAVTHSFRGEEGIELWRASGSQIALTPFPSMLAESHLAAGERAAARAVLEEARRAAQPTGVMHLWQSTVERLLARLLAAEGGAADPEIEHRFGEAIEIARGFDARGLELAARLELARWRRGRPGERLARASLEDLCAGFPADDSVADLVAARALLAERASA